MMRPGKEPRPDWPPQRSAAGLPEGHREYLPSGQVWEVRDGKWVRLPDQLFRGGYQTKTSG